MNRGAGGLTANDFDSMDGGGVEQGIANNNTKNEANNGTAPDGTGNTNNSNMSNVPPQSEHDGQQSSQQPQQQQEPVNFNPRSDPYHPSRRVTIGGSTNTNKMDRRNSLSSMSFNMDDFFGPGAGRRPSMGGDSTFPDALFGRLAPSLMYQHQKSSAKFKIVGAS